MQIVLTDITRFQNQSIVCIAGIDVRSGACVRPLPYFGAEWCKKHNVLAGAILSGCFAEGEGEPPHVEDRQYTAIKFSGHCDLRGFGRVLRGTLSASVEEGFGVEMKAGQKHFATGEAPRRSIVTVAVRPSQIMLVRDEDHPERIKATFTDRGGRRFHRLSVTDLCLSEFAEEHLHEACLRELNAFVHGQEDVLLRVGLTRQYRAPDGREGYWLQVNGLYTFPEIFPQLRSYFAARMHGF